MRSERERTVVVLLCCVCLVTALLVLCWPMMIRTWPKPYHIIHITLPENTLRYYCCCLICASPSQQCLVIKNTPDQMNEWCFRPRFCTMKAILGWGQPGLMRWILLWIMPLVQDRLLDLLTSSPACYDCTTGGPMNIPDIMLYCLLWYSKCLNTHWSRQITQGTKPSLFPAIPSANIQRSHIVRYPGQYNEYIA